MPKKAFRGRLLGNFPKFTVSMNVLKDISILAKQVFRNLKERDSFQA